jgi:hypothetical protein
VIAIILVLSYTFKHNKKSINKFLFKEFNLIVNVIKNSKLIIKTP